MEVRVTVKFLSFCIFLTGYILVSTLEFLHSISASMVVKFVTENSVDFRRSEWLFYVEIQ